MHQKIILWGNNGKKDIIITVFPDKMKLFLLLFVEKFSILNLTFLNLIKSTYKLLGDPK